MNRGYINWKDIDGDKNAGFRLHQQSYFHRHCTGILAQSQCDIAKMMSTDHEKQKVVSCAYHKTVLQNVVFLARQGLHFSGNWVLAKEEGEAGAEVNSNFHQLLLLRAQDDQDNLQVMLQKNKYLL